MELTNEVLAQVREALKPLADYADKDDKTYLSYKQDSPHLAPLPDHWRVNVYTTIGDCRKARAALALLDGLTPAPAAAMQWLTEEELSALADIAREWDMTYEAVMRYALRNCHTIYMAAKQGFSTLKILNDRGEDFFPVVGCGNPGDRKETE